MAQMRVEPSSYSVPPRPADTAGRDPRLAWQRRPSTLARWSLLAYVLLVIDASLYPFTDWTDIGVGAFDYLDAPWPRHFLEFDMVVNLLGYLPLGFLGIAALYPTIRNGYAALIVAPVAFLMSLLLEATQTFLPTRVASKVDLITNFAGALVGIVMGMALTEGLLDRGRVRQLRLIWFERRASRSLIMATLWFGAVLYPQRYAIGCGAVLSELVPHWFEALDAQLALATLWPDGANWFETIDAVVSGTYLCAALLFFLDAARPSAPRIWLLLTFIALTVLAKTMGAGLTYASAQPFIWITPGSIVGFSAAATLATILLGFSLRVRRLATVVLLLIALTLANVGPDNAYFEVASHSWERGRLLNFYGIALGLSLCWPFVAVLLALWPEPSPHHRIKARSLREF